MPCEPPRRALRLFTRSNHRPACASSLCRSCLPLAPAAAYRALPPTLSAHAVVNSSLAAGTAKPTTSGWQHVATCRLARARRRPVGGLQGKGMWLPAARSPRSGGSPSKVAVAIHRAAPSEQCSARARDRAFQNALRRHQARGIQGCRAARNRGRIGQVRTTGKPHRAPCRDEGLIAVIAVAAKGSSVAGGILTTPPAAGRCGRTAEQKQQQTCR